MAAGGKRWRGAGTIRVATAKTKTLGSRGEFSKRNYGSGYGNHGKVIVEFASLWFRVSVIVFEALLQEGVSGLSG
jgi:hypothetical protein